MVSENARRLREEKRLTLDEAAEVIRQHNIKQKKIWRFLFQSLVKCFCILKFFNFKTAAFKCICLNLTNIIVILYNKN